jgi:hypothetical protein
MSSRRARVLAMATIPVITLTFRPDGKLRARLHMLRDEGRDAIDVALVVQRPTLFSPTDFVNAVTGALGHKPPPGNYARALELARRSRSIE